MAGQFTAVLWGDLMMGLLLGVSNRPAARQIARRARRATSIFLQLHPEVTK